MSSAYGYDGVSASIMVVFIHGVAADVVVAPAHRHKEVVRAGEGDRGDHVADPGAADDQRRALVDHAIPDPAGGVVAVVPRADDLAAQAGREILDGALVQGDHPGRHHLLVEHDVPPSRNPGTSRSIPLHHPIASDGRSNRTSVFSHGGSTPPLWTSPCAVADSCSSTIAMAC